MAVGDLLASRSRGADHGDSDDTSQHYDDVSDAQTTTTMDDEKAQWEDWDEDCDASFVCLFCPDTFRSRGETLNHCLSHGFDLNQIKRDWGKILFFIFIFCFTLPLYTINLIID